MNYSLTDTIRTVETPEGVELHLRVAGIWPRAAAWLIDMLIRIAFYIALSLVLGSFGALGSGLILISIFVLEWFYPVLFEVLSMGKTPGKRALGLRVINGDGTPVEWSKSFIRNLLRTVDFLPLMYGFGVLSLLMSRDFQRLGDLAADTLVIYDASAPIKNTVPPLPGLPVPVPLTINEQLAIIGFAERTRQMSDERALELAQIVRPLIAGTDQVVEAKTLIRMANTLIGRQ